MTNITAQILHEYNRKASVICDLSPRSTEWYFLGVACSLKDKTPENEARIIFDRAFNNLISALSS